MADQQYLSTDPTAGTDPNASADGPHGDEYLKTLAPPIAYQVKAIAEGRQQYPGGGFAMRSPFVLALRAAVTQYDPTFDAVNYNARMQTRKDFTSGKSAQQVNAINTVIGHLSNLSDAADALHNSNFTLYNTVANRLSQLTGSPTVTNFNTIKKAVADEVTRVWRQAGGAEADIKQAQENLDSSSSPSQLHGAIATYGHLLESKLDSLRNQYKQGMGTDPVGVITPQSQSTLDKLEQRAGTTSAPSAGGIKILKIEKVPQE